MVYFQYKVYLVLNNESHGSTRHDVPAFPRGYLLPVTWQVYFSTEKLVSYITEPMYQGSGEGSPAQVGGLGVGTMLER